MNTVISYPLFYPDETWLKIAALCWDKVYTLHAGGTVPKEPMLRFESDPLEGLLCGLDVADVSIEPVILEQFERWLSQNASKFTSREALVLSNFIFLEGMFRSSADWSRFTDILEKYGLYRKGEEHVSRIPRFEFEPRLLYPEGVSFDDYYERREYFTALAADDDRWASLVRKASLLSQAAADGEYEKQVVFMPPTVPLHYLSLCAARLAEQKGCDLAATGSAYVQTAMYGPRQLGAETAVAAVKTILPENIGLLEKSKIADLRQEFGVQRLKFQTEIQSLVGDIQKVASEGTLEDLKKAALALAVERYKESEAIFKRARVETINKVFSLTLTPSVLASSLASMLGIGLFAPAAVGSALALFTAQRLLAAAEAKSKAESRGWSYLISLRRSLRPWWKFW